MKDTTEIITLLIIRLKKSRFNDLKLHVYFVCFRDLSTHTSHGFPSLEPGPWIWQPGKLSFFKTAEYFYGNVFSLNIK